MGACQWAHGVERCVEFVCYVAFEGLGFGGVIGKCSFGERGGGCPWEARMVWRPQWRDHTYVESWAHCSWQVKLSKGNTLNMRYEMERSLCDVDSGVCVEVGRPL